jgi:hypothetical protein
MCNAIHLNRRVYTALPWIWLDKDACHDKNKNASAMTCYFPLSERLCPQDAEDSNGIHEQFNLYRGRGRVRNDCEKILEDHNATVADLRAAATEFLFSSLSNQIQVEAERQIQVVFQSTGGVIPSDLVTVHIRWGDKADEMTLVPPTNYVQAVQHIQRDRHRSVETASVFLATEDPRAVYEFVRAAPAGWTIYVDAYFQEMLQHRKKGDMYNASPQMANDLKGRPGLVALGSLLVAMEANDFVVTTASNWSRLINELRQNILDPRCNYCTKVVDLKPGEW